MCGKILAFAVFFSALSAAPSFSQESPEPSFSDQVSQALAPVVETLSPEQAQQLIPIFQLYDSHLATLESRLETSDGAREQLSKSLADERKAREAQNLTTAIEFGLGGCLVGVIVTGAMVAFFSR